MPPTAIAIDLHLSHLGHLFDPRDPLPLGLRRIDHDSERYIVEAVQDFSGNAHWGLVIHLDEPIGIPEGQLVESSIRRHFARQSGRLQRDLRKLIRRGLISLLIGMAFLAMLFITAQFVGRIMGASNWATLFREGLMIIGWVAMWRPLEIFLYDWWPLIAKRRLYDRLGRIEVRVACRQLVSTTSPKWRSPESMDAKAIARWEGEGGQVLPFEVTPAN